jgi:hypothetical protein
MQNKDRTGALSSNPLLEQQALLLQLGRREAAPSESLIET